MIEGGYRGYIGSRPVAGSSYPQKVQNLVIRDYATRHGLDLKLSVTEYAMPGCHMMLQDVLAELDRLDGVILFSLFMLPADAVKRDTIYRQVLVNGCALHAALEEMAMAEAADVARFEETLRVSAWLANTPAGGAWRKQG
jgi:sporadic carbohydrate cluster protein (TIGR04323 family)